MDFRVRADVLVASWDGTQNAVHRQTMGRRHSYTQATTGKHIYNYFLLSDKKPNKKAKPFVFLTYEEAIEGIRVYERQHKNQNANLWVEAHHMDEWILYDPDLMQLTDKLKDI